MKTIIVEVLIGERVQCDSRSLVQLFIVAPVSIAHLDNWHISDATESTTMTTADEHVLLPANYAAVLEEIKERIRRAQVRASLAVNSEMILLYWQIGRDILYQQQQQGWGAKVIDRLSLGFAPDIYRDSWVFSPQYQLYAGFRRGMAGGRICAAACCTNSLVSPLYIARQG